MQRAFARRFVEAQYSWTTMLLEHLVATRRQIGDLDAALILGVVGLSALAATRREIQQTKPGQVPNHDGGLVPPRSVINAHSLAALTGIPRETVRRKLAFLETAGFLERQPNGAWRLAPDEIGHARARRDLQDLTVQSIEGLSRVYERLASLDQELAAEDAGTGEEPAR